MRLLTGTKPKLTPQQKERFKAWLAALRSGKYEQTINKLKKVNGRPEYCCLGVACEVYKARTKRGSWIATLDIARFEVNGHGSSTELPREISDYFGFKPNYYGVTVTPIISDAGNFELLATTANDIRMWDFNKIADEAEQYYLGTLNGKKIPKQKP